MKTTLNAIREHGPCSSGWKKLLTNLGKTEADDEPLSILTILKSNGMNDALWCLRAVTGREKKIRTLALKFARHVDYLSSDPRVKACNDTNERYINGLATKEELAAAGDAAGDAARDARDAWGAARAAAEAAARAARDTAWTAAGAAGDAAWAAALAAARAAGAAGASEWAAWASARAAENAELAWQESELIKLCEECEKEDAK